jgi:hypothetical protein
MKVKHLEKQQENVSGERMLQFELLEPAVGSVSFHEKSLIRQILNASIDH